MKLFKFFVILVFAASVVFGLTLGLNAEISGEFSAIPTVSPAPISNQARFLFVFVDKTTTPATLVGAWWAGFHQDFPDKLTFIPLYPRLQPDANEAVRTQTQFTNNGELTTEFLYVLLGDYSTESYIIVDTNTLVEITDYMLDDFEEESPKWEQWIPVWLEQSVTAPELVNQAQTKMIYQLCHAIRENRGNRKISDLNFGPKVRTNQAEGVVMSQLAPWENSSQPYCEIKQTHQFTNQ